MSITVRNIHLDDESRWRELWDGYCTFYKSSVSPDVTDATWRRITDPASPIFSFVAEDASGQVIGFVNNVAHEFTWATGPACYLEDLFVDPESRSNGAGHALIQAVINHCRREGFERLYWRTDEDNHTARRLYDRFVPVGNKRVYQINF